MPPVAGPSQLPPEVWVHVFGLLSKADKHCIRACCKYFKRLVDHWSLWREDTVVLKKHSGYNSQFWSTLRCRRTTSVLLRSASSKEWEQLARWLPTVTTIAIADGFVKEAFEVLNKFPDLRSLAIRRCRFPQTIHVMPFPQQVTSLSLCEVCGQTAVLLNVVARLTNLTSLSYHMGEFHVLDAFQDMLAHLPHLKHLSLRTGVMFGTLPDDYFCPSEQRGSSGVRLPMGPSLTSLELLDYKDPTLSPLAFTGLASLQSLALSYTETIGTLLPNYYRDRSCHLASWLTSLPQLNVLSITRGPAVQSYASSVPASLTSLTLRVKVEPEELRTLASRVPGLLHLHLDPCSYMCDSSIHVGAIPRLFPQLRTLKIPHQGAPESDLVNLQQMQHLERLEFTDNFGLRSALLMDLQAESQHRIQLVHSPKPLYPLPLTCECAHL